MATGKGKLTKKDGTIQEGNFINGSIQQPLRHDGVYCGMVTDVVTNNEINNNATPTSRCFYFKKDGTVFNVSAYGGSPIDNINVKKEFNPVTGNFNIQSSVGAYTYNNNLIKINQVEKAGCYGCRKGEKIYTWVWSLYDDKMDFNFESKREITYESRVTTDSRWQTTGKGLVFYYLQELSDESLTKGKQEQERQTELKRQEDERRRQEEARLAKIKEEENRIKAIEYEKNRVQLIKSVQIGDRVCFSQGWKHSDTWLGYKYNTENYTMNVICYVENISGDRYQIRVASIKSSNSGKWSYPEINGVQLKEGTIHWIKPLEDQSWNYCN